ncbi:AraC family transcriptional regulator [Robiginitalea sediminis]|uniref:AraC family transcriptional regulator n=1 Tax=Robiginitalea sediminis TaxID=1982593 RepID=UPI000B4C0AEA|nr:helix-turn-helix domain-containing protein [Robiginitalea sediminis]
MLEVLQSTPQISSLQQCIDNYYFLRIDEPSFEESFTHFPHFRTTINVYQNAEIEIRRDSRTICHNQNKRLDTIFTNNISHAKKAFLRGPINIIGNSFRPLGINHFLSGTSFIKADESVVLLNNYWKGFEENMSAVFACTSIQAKTEMLDEYFASIYCPFDQNILKAIVVEIILAKGAIQVKILANKYEINRRTLLRMFNKHLGCSISDFKQVVRFRCAVDNYQRNAAKPSFTELSYNHNYYDQSDFIKHFKMLTKEIPREVLTKMTTVGNQDLYWKLKSKQ